MGEDIGIVRMLESDYPGRTLAVIPVGGCRSIFQGSPLTLGQMADACIYVGGDADVDTKPKPGR